VFVMLEKAECWLTLNQTWAVFDDFRRLSCLKYSVKKVLKNIEWLCLQFSIRSDWYIGRPGTITFQHVSSGMPRNADMGRRLYPFLGHQNRE
jgi:hypothetical protein